VRFVRRGKKSKVLGELTGLRGGALSRAKGAALRGGLIIPDKPKSLSDRCSTAEARGDLRPEALRRASARLSSDPLFDLRRPQKADALPGELR
jgi:hypothetical protein